MTGAGDTPLLRQNLFEIGDQPARSALAPPPQEVAHKVTREVAVE